MIENKEVKRWSAITEVARDLHGNEDIARLLTSTARHRFEDENPEFVIIGEPETMWSSPHPLFAVAVDDEGNTYSAPVAFRVEFEAVER